jgi:hypothetical protein
VSTDSTSRWQLRPSARALVAWRDHELATFASVLDAAVLAWQRDWGLDDTARTTCENTVARDRRAGWQLLGRHAGGAAWIQSAAVVGLCRQLLGTDDASTPIAAEVLAACRQDLRVRCAASLQLAEDSDAAELVPALTAWRGAVEARLAFGARVLVDAGCLLALLQAAGTPQRTDRPKAAPALHALSEAIADLPVPLKIRLRPCEIEVGALQDLVVGDVVLLPHPLDAAAAVEDADGQQLFCGQLARSHGRKAVELAPAPT